MRYTEPSFFKIVEAKPAMDPVSLYFIFSSTLHMGSWTYLPGNIFSDMVHSKKYPSLPPIRKV